MEPSNKKEPPDPDPRPPSILESPSPTPPPPPHFSPATPPPPPLSAPTTAPAHTPPLPPLPPLPPSSTGANAPPHIPADGLGSSTSNQQGAAQEQEQANEAEKQPAQEEEHKQQASTVVEEQHVEATSGAEERKQGEDGGAVEEGDGNGHGGEGDGNGDDAAADTSTALVVGESQQSNTAPHPPQASTASVTSTSITTTTVTASTITASTITAAPPSTSTSTSAAPPTASEPIRVSAAHVPDKRVRELRAVRLEAAGRLSPAAVSAPISFSVQAQHGMGTQPPPIEKLEQYSHFTSVEDLMAVIKEDDVAEVVGWLPWAPSENDGLEDELENLKRCIKQAGDLLQECRWVAQRCDSLLDQCGSEKFRFMEQLEALLCKQRERDMHSETWNEEQKEAAQKERTEECKQQEQLRSSIEGCHRYERKIHGLVARDERHKWIPVEKAYYELLEKVFQWEAQDVLRFKQDALVDDIEQKGNYWNFNKPKQELNATDYLQQCQLSSQFQSPQYNPAYFLANHVVDVYQNTTGFICSSVGRDEKLIFDKKVKAPHLGPIPNHSFVTSLYHMDVEPMQEDLSPATVMGHRAIRIPHDDIYRLLVYFHNPIAYMQVERDYNGIPINAAKEQEEQETAKEIQECVVKAIKDAAVISDKQVEDYIKACSYAIHGPRSPEALRCHVEEIVRMRPSAIDGVTITYILSIVPHIYHAAKAHASESNDSELAPARVITTQANVLSFPIGAAGRVKTYTSTTMQNQDTEVLYVRKREINAAAASHALIVRSHHHEKKHRWYVYLLVPSIQAMKLAAYFAHPNSQFLVPGIFMTSPSISAADSLSVFVPSLFYRNLPFLRRINYYCGDRVVVQLAEMRFLDVRFATWLRDSHPEMKDEFKKRLNCEALLSGFVLEYSSLAMLDMHRMDMQVTPILKALVRLFPFQSAVHMYCDVVVNIAFVSAPLPNFSKDEMDRMMLLHSLGLFFENEAYAKALKELTMQYIQPSSFERDFNILRALSGEQVLNAMCTIYKNVASSANSLTLSRAAFDQMMVIPAHKTWEMYSVREREKAMQLLSQFKAFSVKATTSGSKKGGANAMPPPQAKAPKTQKPSTKITEAAGKGAQQLAEEEEAEALVREAAAKAAVEEAKTANKKRSKKREAEEEKKYSQRQRVKSSAKTRRGQEEEEEEEAREEEDEEEAQEEEEEEEEKETRTGRKRPSSRTVLSTPSLGPSSASAGDRTPVQSRTRSKRKQAEAAASASTTPTSTPPTSTPPTSAPPSASPLLRLPPHIEATPPDISSAGVLLTSPNSPSFNPRDSEDRDEILLERKKEKSAEASESGSDDDLDNDLDSLAAPEDPTAFRKAHSKLTKRGTKKWFTWLVKLENHAPAFEQLVQKHGKRQPDNVDKDGRLAGMSASQRSHCTSLALEEANRIYPGYTEAVKKYVSEANERFLKRVADGEVLPRPYKLEPYPYPPPDGYDSRSTRLDASRPTRLNLTAGSRSSAYRPSAAAAGEDAEADADADAGRRSSHRAAAPRRIRSVLEMEQEEEEAGGGMDDDEMINGGTVPTRPPSPPHAPPRARTPSPAPRARTPSPAPLRLPAPAPAPSHTIPAPSRFTARSRLSAPAPSHTSPAPSRFTAPSRLSAPAPSHTSAPSRSGLYDDVRESRRVAEREEEMGGRDGETSRTDEAMVDATSRHRHRRRSPSPSRSISRSPARAPERSRSRSRSQSSPPPASRTGRGARSPSAPRAYPSGNGSGAINATSPSARHGPLLPSAAYAGARSHPSAPGFDYAPSAYAPPSVYSHPSYAGTTHSRDEQYEYDLPPHSRPRYAAPVPLSLSVEDARRRHDQERDDLDARQRHNAAEREKQALLREMDKEIRSMERDRQRDQMRMEADLKRTEMEVMQVTKQKHMEVEQAYRSRLYGPPVLPIPVPAMTINSFPPVHPPPPPYPRFPAYPAYPSYPTFPPVDRPSPYARESYSSHHPP